MAERKFRSNHADPSTPSMTARPPRRHPAILAVPVAVTALLSVVFGVQSVPGAHAAENPRADRTVKAKTVDSVMITPL